MEEEMTKMPEIDLTKIKNLKAVEETDFKFSKDLKRTANVSSRKMNKQKYCFQPATKIKLPSGGKFYQDSEDEDLRNGFVNIIPMSIADEEIITNRAYIKNGSTLRILFDTCTETNYPAKRFLSSDAIYMMYALRAISYGNNYTFKIKCNECENDFEHTVDIDNLDFDELKETKDQRDIKLPISKFTITMHLMRLEDEERNALLLNQYKDVDAVTPTVISILSRTDCIRDDKGKEIPRSEYVDFLTCLPGRDRMEINRSFEKQNMPSVNVICDRCGNEIEMEIPWESGFFLPTE